MTTSNTLSRIGFTHNDLTEKKLTFPKNERLNNSIGNVYYSGHGENVKTRFYWIDITNIAPKDLHHIHKRVWNENISDLIIFENRKTKKIDINFVTTSPNDKLINIDSISTKESDNYIHSKFNKSDFTSGAFWIKYSNILDQVKKKTLPVDTALIKSLSILRDRLKSLLQSLLLINDKYETIVQALIDRTLFIKFLEDRGILTSEFYKYNFNKSMSSYLDLLNSGDANGVNVLFQKINEIFNNKLFQTPEIDTACLSQRVLHEISIAISGSQGPQLCLFDFQFDIIPIEFISHIYQIFLDDKKSKEGIFYTPQGLANIMLQRTITKSGTVLDPACGSGIFLVLSFRMMYKKPTKSLTPYEIIQDRLWFVKNNIFGIEKENTAARLALFSLYLEVLQGVKDEEIKQLVSRSITKDITTLFTVDISSNIVEENTLNEHKGTFKDKDFDYIVGNPPWFKIERDIRSVNYLFWRSVN